MSARHHIAYGLRCAVDFDWAWCPSEPARGEPDLHITMHGELQAERLFHLLELRAKP